MHKWSNESSRNSVCRTCLRKIGPATRKYEVVIQHKTGDYLSDNKYSTLVPSQPPSRPYKGNPSIGDCVLKTDYWEHYVVPVPLLYLSFPLALITPLQGPIVLSFNASSVPPRNLLLDLQPSLLDYHLTFSPRPQLCRTVLRSEKEDNRHPRLRSVEG